MHELDAHHYPVPCGRTNDQVTNISIYPLPPHTASTAAPSMSSVRSAAVAAPGTARHRVACEPPKFLGHKLSRRVSTGALRMTPDGGMQGDCPRKHAKVGLQFLRSPQPGSCRPPIPCSTALLSYLQQYLDFHKFCIPEPTNPVPKSAVLNDMRMSGCMPRGPNVAMILFIVSSAKQEPSFFEVPNDMQLDNTVLLCEPCEVGRGPAGKAAQCATGRCASVGDSKSLFCAACEA